MDKSWLEKGRCSKEYIQGIKSFLQFAFRDVPLRGKTVCPCVECICTKKIDRTEMQRHLIGKDFSPGYTVWYLHGESLAETSSNQSNISYFQEMPRANANLQDMVGELYRMDTSVPVESQQTRQGTSGQQASQGTGDDNHKFHNLLKDLDQPLYEGCNFSKLSTVVHLYHLKCLGGWSNNSLTGLLVLLNRLLPAGANLPSNSYDAKKIIKALGLGYEKIHACRNGCMLFWKEHLDDEFCSVCGEFRYVKNDMELNEVEQQGNVMMGLIERMASQLPNFDLHGMAEFSPNLQKSSSASRLTPSPSP